MARLAGAPALTVDDHGPVGTEPCDLTALDARARIGRGELSPTELLASCLARIDATDPGVNAMVVRADEQARADASAAADAVVAARRNGTALPPLHGLPVAIKDLQATAGLRTTYGAEAFADHVPTVDDGIVARVRAGGGIVLGKTNIPERSIGANTVNRLFGATGNPFDPALTCGGSSGGSAVAVATGMAPLATGSDHGGSLRIPACYCGVVGYRATPGVVPFDERTTPQTYYSVLGPMARTVSDTALLLSVIADRGRSAGAHPPLDPMAFPLDTGALARLDDLDPAGLRVGVSPDLGGVLVSQDVRDTFADRVSRLGDAVGRCEPVDLDLAAAADVDWRLRADVFVTQYQEERASWDEGFNPNIVATYEAALRTPMEDIAAARGRQLDLIRSAARVFDEFDVVVCPGVSVPPFPWAELYPRTVDGAPVENYMAWLSLTAAITVIGHPVVAVPCGRDRTGLPFGLQVIGPRFADRRVLSVARALERIFADDPATIRPVPDLTPLTTDRQGLRTRGRTVQLDG
ncbi:MAG: amidase [Acidimicrobiales bacterium]